MNDLESSLGHQLHGLADRMTSDADPLDQVTGARSRYRRQRRNRMGLTVAAVATAAIVIGVPTAMGALSATPGGGDVASPVTEAPQTDPVETTEESAEDAAAREAAEAEAQRQRAELEQARDAAAASAAAAAAAAQEAADQQATAVALGASLVRPDGPLRLSIPPDYYGCPDEAADLSGVVGVPLEYWQGRLFGGPLGCQWTTGDPAASPVEDQLTLGLAFLNRGTPEQAQADRAEAADSCWVAAVPDTADPSTLQVCTTAGRTEWFLDVADANELGVWVVSALVGNRFTAVDPISGLTAVADQAADAWG